MILFYFEALLINLMQKYILSYVKKIVKIIKLFTRRTHHLIILLIYCILTKSFEDRENIRCNLEKQNIESRPLWKPMHLQPVFEKYPSYLNGNSENLFEKGLCLPSGSNLADKDKYRIVSIIENTINK